MNDLSPVIAGFTDHELRRAHRRFALAANIALAASLACLTAGVWVDWRWLPTAVVPAVICGIAAAAAGICHTEMRRRAREDL